MQTIHFGAGKIGRGFIGAVLRGAGHEVCFADVNRQMVDAINRECGYTVHVLDARPHRERVEGIRAIHTEDPTLPDMMAEADLVTTAVSMNALPMTAPLLARGIRRRMERGNGRPLNVIACENGIRATSRLKALTLSCMTGEEGEWAESHIGWADSSVDRIVPLSAFENPLDVAVESFLEWNVDQTQILGPLPPVPAIHFTERLTAHIERKLFTVNTGHCATAFLGNLRGYQYIHECMADAELRARVESVMQQSGAALMAKWGFDPERHAQYIRTVLQRFANPHIKDLTARVGHDPRRKLGPTLYFSYPIAMALQHHLPTHALSLAVAAGMTEKIEGDPQCDEIACLIAAKGLSQAIAEITEITHPRVVGEIIQAYQMLNS